MGQITNGTVSQCYNGPDYDYLGWMQDRTGVIDTSITTSLVDLAFYGDYNIATPQQPTLIIVNGLYLQYNLQTGLNADSYHYDNQVLVHSKNSSDVHHGTVLVGTLNETSPTFDVPDHNTTIQFCQRRPGITGAVANSVMLAIGSIGLNLEAICSTIPEIGELR
jgi:hypothetical protein